MPCCRLSHTDAQGGVELSMEVMKLLCTFIAVGGIKLGQTQPHVPLPHPDLSCSLSKPVALTHDALPGRATSSSSWTCGQPHTGVAPQERGGNFRGPPTLLPHPSTPTASPFRGSGLSCRPPNLRRGARSLPAELEPSGSPWTFPKERDTGRWERSARLHASAAAATARLNGNSEDKTCGNSAR